MSEKRYRLELKEVGTERVQVAAQECTVQEIANMVVVRAQNPRDAMHMNDLIRTNKPFGDRKHLVVWGAFEFYAVELPAHGVGSITGCTCPMCEFHRSAEAIERRKVEVCPTCNHKSATTCDHCHLGL